MQEAFLHHLGGSHGDELIGVELHKLLRRFPILGVRSRIAHPRAVKAGKRFIGSSQIMSHYGRKRLDWPGDEEDRAARANERWMGSRRNNPNHVILDSHESAVEGLNHFVIGGRASSAAIAVAWRLGYQRGVVSAKSSFFRTVCNGVASETFIISDTQRREVVWQLYLSLHELASVGIQQLQSEGIALAQKIEFWKAHEIMLVNPANGRPTDTWNILEELETITARPAHAPLNLPQHIRRSLGLGLETRLSYGSWRYNGRSPLRQDLGRASDGRQRREVFGTIHERLGQPRINGLWVEFGE